MNKNLVVFIISHGRADKLATVDELKRDGYTGDYFIVIDDEDDQIDKYKSNFGEEHIIVFNKSNMDNKFDIMDNFTDWAGRGVPTFARNVLHSLAKERGYDYFFELEDDYNEFNFRLKSKKNSLLNIRIKNLDEVLEAMVDCLDSISKYYPVNCVCMAQGGDLIGGLTGTLFRQKVSRKAMNSFLCKVDNPWQFVGRFNDDCNAYTRLGNLGQLFFTTSMLAIHQPLTQLNAGGITENYKKFGTYVKSYYSVMLNPSAVKVQDMGVSHKRMHHALTWNNAVPCIVSEKYKKK